jgi:hypothetical protein
MGITHTLTRKTSEVFFLNHESFPSSEAVLTGGLFLCPKREYLLLVIFACPRETMTTYPKGI